MNDQLANMMIHGLAEGMLGRDPEMQYATSFLEVFKSPELKQAMLEDRSDDVLGLCLGLARLAGFPI